MTNAATTVTLTCHHTLVFRAHPPVRGEMVWCRLCRNYKEVIHAREHFNIRCQQCRYARSFGAMLDEAKAKAHRHVRTRQAHKVEVRDGRVLLEIVTYDSVSLYRPDSLKVLQQHQSILRDHPTSLPNRYPN